MKTPSKELIAISQNGFEAYIRHGIKLDNHVKLDMVQEVIQHSYLYQDMERISKLIPYELSGKGHKRRLIVALIKYNGYYEISKAFWKRNLHFIGHAKNLYPVYFDRNFCCNINPIFLKRIIENATLEKSKENYRIKSRNPMGYVDHVPLEFHEDIDDLIKVIRFGERHPIYMSFSSPQEITRLSIDFERKSDIDGTYYVITNMVFTGLEAMPRPWELDPEDELYLPSMEFWRNHAYAFIPKRIRSNVTD